MCGVVEHVQGNQSTWWLDGVGWTIVAAAGDAMSELALSTESCQHIGSRQFGQVPQSMDAEPLQEFDEFVVEPGDRSQQMRRLRCEEIGRRLCPARNDHG